MVMIPHEKRKLKIHILLPNPLPPCRLPLFVPAPTLTASAPCHMQRDDAPILHGGPQAVLPCTSSNHCTHCSSGRFIWLHAARGRAGDAATTEAFGLLRFVSELLLPSPPAPPLLLGLQHHLLVLLPGSPCCTWSWFLPRDNVLLEVRPPSHRTEHRGSACSHAKSHPLGNACSQAGDRGKGCTYGHVQQRFTHRAWAHPHQLHKICTHRFGRLPLPPR